MPEEIVCFGEMLWDILPEKELPGGAPMNVAYHLRKLGEAVSLVSRVGNDARGRALLDMLAGYRISTAFVQTDAVHETGKVYANMADPHDVHYDIVFPAAWDFIGWDSALAQLMDKASTRCLVFGSLSSRNGVSRETLERMLEGNVLKVLDINLREPHYTRPHIEWLLQHCSILKLNIAELELISSWYQPFTGKEEAVRELSARFNISTIVVTMGAGGALLFMNNACFFAPGIRVEVADTIGSGDAFLAGFLHSLLRHRAPEQCLQFANALGALVAAYPGGCPEYGIEEIARFKQV